MDPVTVLTLVSLGVTASASLYKTIDGLGTRKQDVRSLKAEVGDLNIVLQALAKNIEETTENFEVLRLILKQCTQACKGFEQEVLNKIGKTGSRAEEVKAWARLQFLGGDIDNFRKLIGSYKATVTIALVDSNLRTAKVTKQLLEKYTEMTQDTTSDLEDQIADLSHRLDVLQTESATASSAQTSGRGSLEPIETRQTLEQKASLEQCLIVCHRLLDHVEEARRLIPRDAATTTTETANGDHGADGINVLAPRLTVDALQMCTHNINAAARLLQDLRTAKKTPDNSDEREILQQLDSARQCLTFVDQAQHRVNVYEDIDTGEESFQTVVSTIGDLIRARGLKIGSRSVNIMGQMQDESLQKLSNDLRGNVGERPVMKDADIAFEKKHGFGYTVQPRRV